MNWINSIHRDFFTTAFIFTLVLLIVNSPYDAWMFTNIGWIDPWIYTGYGFHYNDPEYLNWYYKSSRVPWIWLLHVIYSTFNPILSIKIIIFLYLINLFFAMYLIVKTDFNRTTAFLTAFLFMMYTPNWANGGWDYHNTFCGPVFLWAFYFFKKFTDSDYQYKTFFLGLSMFFMTSIIHVNPVNINLLLIFAIYFIYKKSFEYSFKKFAEFTLKTIFVSLLFVIASTVFWGMVNVAYGRDFLFFKSQLFYVLFELKKNNYWVPLSEVIKNSNLDYLLLPLAVFIASIVALSKDIILDKRRLADKKYFYLVQYVCIFLLWLFWHLIKQTSIAPDYFYYPVYASMGMAISYFFNINFNLENKQIVKLSTIIILFLFIIPSFFYDVNLFKLFCFGIILCIMILFASKYRLILLSFFIFLAVGSSNQVLNILVNTILSHEKNNHVELLQVREEMLNFSNNNYKDFYIWFPEKVHINYITNKCTKGFGNSLANFNNINYFGPAWPTRPIEEIDYVETLQNKSSVFYIGLITESENDIYALTDSLKNHQYILTKQSYYSPSHSDCIDKVTFLQFLKLP